MLHQGSSWVIRLVLTKLSGACMQLFDCHWQPFAVQHATHLGCCYRCMVQSSLPATDCMSPICSRATQATRVHTAVESACVTSCVGVRGVFICFTCVRTPFSTDTNSTSHAPDSLHASCCQLDSWGWHNCQHPCLLVCLTPSDGAGLSDTVRRCWFV
jgi:hypothetical protein